MFPYPIEEENLRLKLKLHFDFVIRSSIGRFSSVISTRSAYSSEFREFKSTADNLNMPLSLLGNSKV